MDLRGEGARSGVGGEVQGGDELADTSGAMAARQLLEAAEGRS